MLRTCSGALWFSFFWQVLARQARRSGKCQLADRLKRKARAKTPIRRKSLKVETWRAPLVGNLEADQLARPDACAGDHLRSLATFQRFTAGAARSNMPGGSASMTWRIFRKAKLVNGKFQQHPALNARQGRLGWRGKTHNRQRVAAGIQIETGQIKAPKSALIDALSTLSRLGCVNRWRRRLFGFNLAGAFKRAVPVWLSSSRSTRTKSMPMEARPLQSLILTVTSTFIIRNGPIVFCGQRHCAHYSGIYGVSFDGTAYFLPPQSKWRRPVKAHLIHNLDQHTGFFAIGLNNRAALRVFGIQFFDIGAHRSQIDLTPVDSDFIIVTNGNENGDAVFADRGFGIGPGHQCRFRSTKLP